MCCPNPVSNITWPTIKNSRNFLPLPQTLHLTTHSPIFSLVGNRRCNDSHDRHVHNFFLNYLLGQSPWNLGAKPLVSQMLIHKVNPSVDHNRWLKRLDTSLWSNQSKNPKLSRQWMRKRYYKTLGTSEINSPMSPSIPGRYFILFSHIIVNCYDKVQKTLIKF